MKATNGRLAAVLAILLSACAPAAMNDGADGPEPRVGRSASISVENRNWMDMNVYLVQGTTRVRLGMVTGMSRATFSMPRGMEGYPGQLRLLADPIGSLRGYLSEPVQIRPGQQVALQVGDNLNQSFVSIWN
jgi:hypothetical protein